MDFKIGDKIWFIPGYRGHHLIAIHCTITEIDDEFRKLDPKAYLFYWIDEPVGHALGNDEMYLTRKEAISRLRKRADDLIADGDIEELELNANLDTYRVTSIDSIIGTWKLSNTDAAKKHAEIASSLKEKEQPTEWFNLYDIGLRCNIS